MLLGQKYGWRPLPYEIGAELFEKIHKQVLDSNYKAQLARWYLRDDNAMPLVYCLQLHCLSSVFSAEH